jgi:tetratricopeptide (TPR) repeat protein
VRACIWVAGTTKDGTHVTVGGLGPARHLRHYLERELAGRGAKMEVDLRDAKDFTNRNDYAVALIFQGKYPEAIEVLEQQEKEKPGEYFTAANLGTALELSGRNEEALKWISEGMRRNTNSHEGTEWMHAMILQAKIKAEREPDYFKKHSVLDLNYSQIERNAETLTVGGVQRDRHDVEGALQYQLQERLQFVKTKDAPVASLLFDYAAITAATHSLEAAKEVLKMAMEFGYPADRVQPLLARYDRIITIASIRQWLIYLSIALFVVVFLIYAVKRGWITMSRSPRTHPDPLETRRTKAS